MQVTYDPPTWLPLENLAKNDKRIDVDDFMFMGTAHDKGVHIHLYKHRLTRRYINLDDNGNFFLYASGLQPAAYVRIQDTEGVIVPAVGLNT